MSRIGKKLIEIPQGVKVELSDKEIKLSGPKGELTEKIHQEIKPSLPIFALSAYNEQEMKEAHPGADFPVHLDKPLEPRALAKAWQACQTGQQ